MANKGRLLMAKTRPESKESLLSVCQDAEKVDVNRVYVAEDCAYTMLAIQNLLQSFNIDGDIGTNGHQAYESVKFRLERSLPMYKLILLDYQMPICDGLRSFTKIKDLFKRENIPLKDQPFICCMTESQDFDFVSKTKSVGMENYLVKPVLSENMHKLL